jgi:cyclopropane-fatty-acyl-phospholipid synthase
MGATGKCCTLLILLLAIIAGVLKLTLDQPKYAEMAVRKIVQIGGIPEKELWDNVKIKDETAWVDIITKLNLGIAEGYMHGKIELDPLQLFFTVLNGTSVGTRRKEGTDYLGMIMSVVTAPTMIQGYFQNMQTRSKSTRVTKEHYDAGNDLYEVMLGPTMSYTCAYWKGVDTLDQAQTQKFDLIRRKLQLTPGMKVADLGMGWGTAAQYMNKQGKVDVTGVSLSEQQVKWASENLKAPGLRFVWQDYRDHCEDPKQIGTYDRVYSIGMAEHIGWQNMQGFFKCIKKLLKPDGLAVVHTIGEPDFVPASDPFLDKYIFPGAVIPAMSTMTKAFEDDFILEDWQNFGYDYAKTLAAWDVNSKKFFKDNPKAYTPEFQRMWEYYLKMCEALFELRINQLWHFVLSPRPAYRTTIERQL